MPKGVLLGGVAGFRRVSFCHLSHLLRHAAILLRELAVASSVLQVFVGMIAVFGYFLVCLCGSVVTICGSLHAVRRRSLGCPRFLPGSRGFLSSVECSFGGVRLRRVKVLHHLILVVLDAALARFHAATVKSSRIGACGQKRFGLNYCAGQGGCAASGRWPGAMRARRRPGCRTVTAFGAGGRINRLGDYLGAANLVGYSAITGAIAFQNRITTYRAGRLWRH